MNRLSHDCSLAGLDALDGPHALGLFVGVDERPLRGVAGLVDWRLCGGLSRLLEQGFFLGESEENLLLPSNGKLPQASVFVFGVGKRVELGRESFEKNLQHAARTLARAKVQELAIAPPSAGSLTQSETVSLVRQAFAPFFKEEALWLLLEPN